MAILSLQLSFRTNHRPPLAGIDSSKSWQILVISLRFFAHSSMEVCPFWDCNGPIESSFNSLFESLIINHENDQKSVHTRNGKISTIFRSTVIFRKGFLGKRRFWVALDSVRLSLEENSAINIGNPVFLRLFDGWNLDLPIKSILRDLREEKATFESFRYTFSLICFVFVFFQINFNFDSFN